MRQHGTIKSINGSKAVVVVKRPTACGENCASCSGSCTAVLHEVFADNEIGAQVGQKVIIEMENKKVFKAIFLVYVFPIAALILGYMLAGLVLCNEKWAALTAFGFMAASFALIYFKGKKQEYKHRIVEIINSI